MYLGAQTGPIVQTIGAQRIVHNQGLTLGLQELFNICNKNTTNHARDYPYFVGHTFP